MNNFCGGCQLSKSICRVCDTVDTPPGADVESLRLIYFRCNIIAVDDKKAWALQEEEGKTDEWVELIVDAVKDVSGLGAT